MRKMSADEIRDTWLQFFKSKGHYIEPSANLIPQNDPTLLWINAGVAALKKYFDGSTRPEHRRITNAQKCIRTNDIENVGHTSRHQTFFEMLGNFSIGDYFRNEVIPWACELLLDEKWFGIPNTKLYVTYYPDDLATKKLWIDNGMLEDHLIPLATNFWEIGEGPGGPDTEIYFDRGEKYDLENRGVEMLKNDEDNDRYIEIWNIVFSQYNCQPGVLKRSQYKELPQKNIDTGAGLERFCCVIQGVDTNFDTDLFKPIIDWISLKSNKPYEGENKLAYRVIADHVRSVTFALADGANFSNDGRGYVLRRLLRRAIRYANKLGLKTGALAELVYVCSKNMSHFYPYLLDQQDKVSKMVLSEEEKFSKTLKQGEGLLNEYLAKSDTILSGEDAFKLSDTYGFPIELTIEISKEHGKDVDLSSYNKCLEDQKQRARNARGNRESFKSQDKDLLEFTSPSEFNYDDKILTSKVIGIFKDGKKVDQIDDEGDIVFDNTNFYAESGGQIYDLGEIKNDTTSLNVTGVFKAPNKQHLHHVDVLFGKVKLGDTFTLIPDFTRRAAIRKNHSSAHLFQAALQQVVSKDCHQAGSYEDDKVMRFDFTLNRKLTDEELDKIEDIVNSKIAEGIKQETKIMDIKEAEKEGAMHLFSEKYSQQVRVVCFGSFSKEFCAGTHVNNTSEIGIFVIGSEEAISSGVRRVTCYTSYNAYKYLKEKELELKDISSLINVNSDKEILPKLKANISEQENTKKYISTLESKIVSSLISEIKTSYEVINSKKIFVSKVNNLNHNQVLDIIKAITSEENSAILVLNIKQGKSELGIGISSNLLSNYKAGVLVKNVTSILGGSGGGKPDTAFGGFTLTENIDKAISIFKESF